MAIKERFFFFNDKDELVDETNASKFILRKEDENGNLISESFGLVKDIIDEEEKQTVKNDIFYVSREEYEFLKKFDAENNFGINFDCIKIKE